jgi:hypothetical protein
VKHAPLGGPSWFHTDIISGTAGGLLQVITTADQKGVFINRSASGVGNISTTSITLELSGIQGQFPDFKVFGTEMVFVPQGPFYVGDGSEEPFKFRNGANPSLPFQVLNSGNINAGNGADEINPWYAVDNIPAAFPNGFDAFYCMKYKISQSQYAEFLNTLNFTQKQQRTRATLPFSGFVFHGLAYRNGIWNNGDNTFGCNLNNNATMNQSSDGLGLSMNYLTPFDLLAFLDWAALRPMTEMEYEKACRGPIYPVSEEMASGVPVGAAKEVDVLNIVNSGLVTETVNVVGSEGVVNTDTLPFRVGFAASSTTNRAQSVASYYGIQDLSNNPYDMVIFISGNLIVNSYLGSHGDGILENSGDHNQADWPNVFREFMSKTFLEVSNRGNSGFEPFGNTAYRPDGGRGIRGI